MVLFISKKIEYVILEEVNKKVYFNFNSANK